MRTTTLGIPALAATLALGLTTTAPATAEPPPPAPGAARKAPQPAKTVTLITGDRVTVSADLKPVSLLPGPGRRRMTFRTHRWADSLLVVPSDMTTLVASGRLDQRLFDVAGLVRGGYDDKASSVIPLIVGYGKSGVSARSRAGVAAVRALPAARAEAVRVTKSKAGAFLTGLPRSGQRFAGGVDRIWLDGKRRTSLDQSVPQIGTPAAWQAGYTGKGVTVAVLDGGIDATHPDLASQVAEAKNFTADPAGDGDGHGTHVASTVAGTGVAATTGYRGVAPDARLLDGKVCSGGGCWESDILAGMQWAAAEKKADVINMSLGGPDTPDLDPVEAAVNTLTAQTGSLFVVAAGNSGPETPEVLPVSSPASADAALAVGAVDREDAIAGFSSRGPRTGDSGLKPDVTAPGVGIVAAKAKDAWIGEPVGEHYLRLSGTSMATPHVAGAAALLVQQHPDWTPAQLKAALMASAEPNAAHSVYDEGAGRIDLAKAITQNVVSLPGSLSFGATPWPHGDDTPVDRDLVYRNYGSTDVTLTLRADLRGPDGRPAPAGAIILGAGTVTVPAGGSATVTATVNTRHDGPDGAYSGHVVATSTDGRTTVGTPVGVDKETEKYDLTLRFTGPDGKPTSDGNGSALLGSGDEGWIRLLWAPEGSVTVRLPRGHYLVDGLVLEPLGNDEYDAYILVDPQLELESDRTVEIDARRTKPYSTTVPRADAELAHFNLTYSASLGRFGLNAVAGGADLSRIHTAPLGEPVSPEGMTSTLVSHWARPDGAGGFKDSPYGYHLKNTRPGGMFDGFSRTVSERDLAVVTTQLNAPMADPSLRTVRTLLPDDLPTLPTEFERSLPSTMTSYLEAGGVQWAAELKQLRPDDPFFPVASFTSTAGYQAGKKYRELWNGAVITPQTRTALAGWFDSGFYTWIPMYSDSSGHRGSSETSAARTKLYQGDELLGESDLPGELDLPELTPRQGTFRLESTATRAAGLSTRTDVAWTFTRPTAEWSLLPLWSVRYQPFVAADNTLRRHPATVVPLVVEADPDSPVGKLKTVQVEVSGDDGASWRKAVVRRIADGRYAAAFATPTGTYVSLRAKVTDDSGNAVEQTVIRAYRHR